MMAFPVIPEQPGLADPGVLPVPMEHQVRGVLLANAAQAVLQVLMVYPEHRVLKAKLAFLALPELVALMAPQVVMETQARRVHQGREANPVLLL